MMTMGLTAGRQPKTALPSQAARSLAMRIAGKGAVRIPYARLILLSVYWV